MNLGGAFNGQRTREDFKADFSLASLAPHRADEPATIDDAVVALRIAVGRKRPFCDPPAQVKDRARNWLGRESRAGNVERSQG